MSMFSFKLPAGNEPVCSGVELWTEPGETLVLTHFHASITICFKESQPCPFFRAGEFYFACEIKVDGTSLGKDRIWLGKEPIGKTLFCSGFPCLTVTGLEDGRVIVTLAEIVTVAC